MVIPSEPLYPSAFDTDNSLFLVHDALRVTLSEDYIPGDTSITISGDPDVIAKFPATGIITLTEQCNEPEFRATSFFYGSRTTTTFDELELMPGFTDIGKTKNVTNVTQNVYADHHNILKDACIAIEEFLGIAGVEDTAPFGDTIVGRLNFLRRLVLPPRAWFTADKRIGIVPVTVTFTDQSFRDPTSFVFDFGDGATTASVASVASVVSASPTTPELTPIVSGAVPCGDITPPTDAERIFTHTYFTPGKYDVTLTVGNKFGQDTIVIPAFFSARAAAPDEANLLVAPTKVRTNQVVNIEVTDNGEQTDGDGDAIDAVLDYTWKLGDDLVHNSAPTAVALYSIGGIYDVTVRVDTQLGAYRITTIQDAVNVVEQTNLWLLAFNSAKSTLSATKTLQTYEFGLISESWKSNVMPDLSVTRDFSFTSGYPNESYQRDAFLRNASIAQKGTVASGDRGAAILYWAEDSTTIRFQEFAPFNEVWSSAGLAVGDTQAKNWNWVGINSPDNIHIILGLDTVTASPTSVSSNRKIHNLSTLASSSNNYAITDFVNGADDLLTLPDSVPATYRAAFRGSNGYIARNDAGPGAFFRIRSFYQTEGNLSDAASLIRKLPDIAGTAKTELEIVPLSSGIFVFNNSGEVAVYSPTTNVWATGGPGVGSVAFRSLQDSSVSGFAETSQTLRAASDGDRLAYLSYDYSANAFVKFNEADLTFSSLGSRPTSNEQYLLTVF